VANPRSRRPPSRLKLVSRAEDAGEPLAPFIARRGGISEDEARAAVLRGGAFVQGKRVKDAARAIAPGERVEVLLRERGDAPGTPVPLEAERILHVDAQVIFIDKPAGVLAQEGRAGGPALPELVADLLRARGEPAQALLVHRLDRGTTGCTVLARTRGALAALLEEFREGRVRKEYRAWVRGEPREDAFTVDFSLGPDPFAPNKRRVDAQGEPARTRVEVLARRPGVALIGAFPETGRTHQIRVHLAALGLPLLGDARYGGPQEMTGPTGARLELPRPLLHALSLGLAHPAGGALAISAPLPQDFAQVALYLG
jgi:23S rRNA pseudouridine1911/1915/1917 synthase